MLFKTKAKDDINILHRYGDIESERLSKYSTPGLAPFFFIFLVLPIS